MKSKKIFSILILSSFLIGSTVLTFTSAFENKNMDILAKDNGLQKLKSGEFLVVRTKSNSSPNRTHKVSLAGQPVEFQEGQGVFLVEGDSSSNILAPVGQFGTEVYGLINLPSSPTRKVQPSVIEQIKKNGAANVILRTKIRERYFGKGRQSQSERFARRQEFQDVRRSIESALSRRGKLTKDLQVINGFAASIDQESLEALQRHPSISEIRIDQEARAFLDASTQLINATKAWSMTNADATPLKGTGIRIAVIDTGVDYTHPDLGGCFGAGCKVVGGYDYYNFDSDPMDDHGHGTHCASTAAGSGTYPGVAPEAQIYAYKVLNQYGSGGFSTVIQGIQAAMDPNGDGNTDDHVDVISMSLGGPGDPEDDVSEAVDAATAVGVTSAIAAGNSGPTSNTIQSPGVAATAITVAASCKPDQIGVDYRCDDNVAWFSSRGPVFAQDGTDLQKPDVAAPGVMICAARWGNAFADSPTCLDSHHVRISGTSMATPHVAGAIALLKQSQPWLTPEELKQTFKSTATSLGMDATIQGAGLIDVEAAVLQSGDFDPSIITQPSYWTVVSNPTVQTSEHALVFNVSGVAIGSSTLHAELNSPINGVAFSTVPGSFDIENGASEAFTATIQINHDVALSGVYSREILIKDSSNILRGSIHVNLTVSPSVIVTASSLNYGVDNPSLATWTSAANTIQITNLRTDIAQNVSLTMAGFPIGVAFDPSTTLMVGPGQTLNVDTTLTANNLIVPNGIYTGTLTLDNGVGSTYSVSATFTKYYVLNVVDAAQTPFFIIVHDRTSTSYFKTGTPGQTVFYVNQPGNYDLIAGYYIEETWKINHIFKENFAVSGDVENSITISNSDAVYTLDNIMTAADTSTYVPYFVINRINFKGTFLGTSSVSGAATGSPALQNFSQMSSNYLLERTYEPYMYHDNANIFYDSLSTGISSDVTFTNAATDFKGPTVRLGYNLPEGTSNDPYLFYQTSTPFSISTYYPNTGSDTIKVQSLLPTPWNFADHGGAGSVVIRSNSTRNDCPAVGICESVFETPMFYPTDSTDELFFWDAGTPLAPHSVDKVTAGLGPMVWFGRFENENTQIVLGDLSNMGIVFKRQDYAIAEYDPVSFDVLNSTNATIGSGEIPGYYHGFADDISIVGFPNVLESTTYALPSAGKYTVTATIPYSIQGSTYLGTAKATFKTNIEDKNPPSLRKLYVFDKDYNRVEVCKLNKKSIIEFEVDPVGGNIDTTKTTMKYSYDTGATGSSHLDSWPSTNGITFSGKLPKIAAATKVTVTLKTRDDSKNILEYQFELPIQ